MNNGQTARPIPLALTALIALFGARRIALSGGHNAAAHGLADDHSEHNSEPLDEGARAAPGHAELWDYITWTRLAIISLTTDAPGTQATVARLLRTRPTSVRVRPFYGKAAAKQLTVLLRGTS